MSATLIIQFVMLGVVTFLVGFVIGRDTRHPIDVKDIDGYIKKTFPDVWAAYHRGINEGYEQGLRDCGEDG